MPETTTDAPTTADDITDRLVTYWVIGVLFGAMLQMLRRSDTPDPLDALAQRVATLEGKLS